MKLIFGVLLLATSAAAAVPTFYVAGGDPAVWAKVFNSVNIHQASSREEASIVVVQGYGEPAAAIGIKPSEHRVMVRRIVDKRAPGLAIIWKEPVEILSPALPQNMEVFATEAHSDIPLLAGTKTAHGALLWVATDPGQTGTEHYPYLLQALTDLGVELPARSSTLWAFFDSSYRIRADSEYLAQRWRAAGISVLHVAGWHTMEPDPAQDKYLAELIAACHRHAILVYAWLELPHVSEKFWAQHPEWREQTAAGQDAQLDWRKLMNLQNPDCHRAASQEIATLLDRFDWDGVNLAELYFESLEGASNPARFTPLNADVRKEFGLIGGFDPMLLFDAQSPHAAGKNPGALRKFLDFRAVLAARLQSDWLAEVRKARVRKPYLDTVLTHIDDRFDPAIRDELGADVKRVLPTVRTLKATLLVEDPANLWDLGAERYEKLGAQYRALTSNAESLAVDINVVDRYQDVYPTKRQTGVELLQLIHAAANSFGHVALYFENSIEKEDLPLLAAAGTTAEVHPQPDGSTEVRSQAATWLPWDGNAAVDGQPWPLHDEHFLLLSAGKHLCAASAVAPPVTLADFNGNIQSVLVSKQDVTLSYQSGSRAIVRLRSPVATISVDGAAFWSRTEHAGDEALLLPAGQHLVTFRP